MREQLQELMAKWRELSEKHVEAMDDAWVRGATDEFHSHSARSAVYDSCVSDVQKILDGN